MAYPESQKNFGKLVPMIIIIRNIFPLFQHCLLLHIRVILSLRGENVNMNI